LTFSTAGGRSHFCAASFAAQMRNVS